MGKRGSLTGIATAIGLAIAYWVVNAYVRRPGQRELPAHAAGGLVAGPALRPRRSLSAAAYAYLTQVRIETACLPRSGRCSPICAAIAATLSGADWSVVISNVIWIFFPQVIRVAIDDLNQGVTRQKILLYAGLLVAISAAKGVFLFLTRWIIIGISREIEFDLRNDLFRHLERQPAAYFQQHRTGDIMARMTNDLNAVRMLLGPAIMYSANTVLFSVGALVFPAPHQPLADPGGAGPAAPGQHPGAGHGAQDS